MEKQNFYDLNFDQLKAFLIEKGEVEPKKAKMRSQQLFNAVYKKNIKSFDELTTFGVELRNKIKDLISLAKPKIIDVQKSKDGTIKFLLELKDKRNVETVLIPINLKVDIQFVYLYQWVVISLVNFVQQPKFQKN